MPPKKRFLLRIAPELYKELERWASDDFRSVNAQIEFLLRDAVHRGRRRQPQPEREPKPEQGGPEAAPPPADDGESPSERDRPPGLEP